MVFPGFQVVLSPSTFLHLSYCHTQLELHANEIALRHTRYRTRRRSDRQGFTVCSDYSFLGWQASCRKNARRFCRPDGVLANVWKVGVGSPKLASYRLTDENEAPFAFPRRAFLNVQCSAKDSVSPAPRPFSSGLPSLLRFLFRICSIPQGVILSAIVSTLVLGVASVVSRLSSLLCTVVAQSSSVPSSPLAFVDVSSIPTYVGNALRDLYNTDLAVLSSNASGLFILVALLCMCAFFSAAETAITTLWPWKVREIADREGPDSPFALIERDVTRFLTTILVGNNLVIIGATALTTETAMRVWGHAGVGVATWVMTFLILFLGEITPKSAAVHKAEEMARIAAYPIHILSQILFPIGRFFSWASSFILKLGGLETSTEVKVTDQELKLIVSGAERSGTIDEREEDMINSVLELDETPVREVMVNRLDMVAVDVSTTLGEFLKLEQENKFSRVPVYESSIDNIVGVAYAKELLKCVGDPDALTSRTVRSITQPVYFVPESMPVWNLLMELRIRKNHMAIVVDEFGGTAGLVTLEDCIEEIVGEIYDETDEAGSPVTPLPDGAGYMIQANAPLNTVCSELGIELPDGEYETLSGFLFDVFGYIPKVGEAVVTSSYRFVIDQADERHIVSVRAEHYEEPSPTTNWSSDDEDGKEEGEEESKNNNHHHPGHPPTENQGHSHNHNHGHNHDEELNRSVRVESYNGSRARLKTYSGRRPPSPKIITAYAYGRERASKLRARNKSGSSSMSR